MKKYILVQLTILLLLAAFFIPTNAQLLPKTVSLNTSPSSPSPGETVTVTASTPFFDKNTAYFDWTVNGTPRDDFSGLGKNTITFKAGSLGSVISVHVAVSRSGGAGGVSDISLSVSDLALIWFANTRVPAWYKGKALPTLNAEVEIVAFPELVLEGVRLPASHLIYRWSFDNEKNILTGVGERTFRIRTSSSPRVTHRVRVEVEDTEKRVKKERVIFISSVSPRAFIYPFSPLGGVEPRNGTGIVATVKRGLIDFIAEPFFLIARERDFRYNWSVERAPITAIPSRPNLLTLSTQEGPSHAIPVSVSVSGDDKFSAPVFGTLNVILR